MPRDPSECIWGGGHGLDKWAVARLHPVLHLRRGERVCSVCRQVFQLGEGDLIPPHPKRASERS